MKQNYVMKYIVKNIIINLALSKAQHNILKIATNIYQEFITIIYNYTEHLYGCFDKVIVANSHSNMQGFNN